MSQWNPDPIMIFFPLGKSQALKKKKKINHKTKQLFLLHPHVVGAAAQMDELGGSSRACSILEAHCFTSEWKLRQDRLQHLVPYVKHE